MNSPAACQPQATLQLRTPTAEDAAAVHDLIARCQPLDANSLYCNLLQCSLFSSTCVLAERNGQLQGFISALIPPQQPDCLFVWQVAVDPSARGQGLGRTMLLDLLSREHCRGVTQLQTSITEDNAASWALFNSLARHLRAELTQQVLFDRQRHFANRHPTEMLVTICQFAV